MTHNDANSMAVLRRMKEQAEKEIPVCGVPTVNRLYRTRTQKINYLELLVGLMSFRGLSNIYNEQ